MKFPYTPIFYLIVISFIVSIAIFALSILVVKKKRFSIEKISSYECGFNPYEDSRNLFDVHFYLIAILFIIFDIEAIFIYPWAISISDIHGFGFWVMLDFIVELVIGYIYIFKRGVFNI